MIGNYMIFNLFVAILLEEFEGDEEEEEEDEKLDEEAVNEKLAKEKELWKSKRSASAQVLIVPTKDPSGKVIMKKYKVSPIDGSNEEVGEDTDENDEEPDKMIMGGTALGILSPENPLRVACFNLANHPYFDQFILILIGISTICLCIDEPYIEDCKTTTCAGLFTVLDTIDKVLSWLFIVEMTIKIIALGLIGDEHAYLRNYWNMLDFFIVCISIYSWTQDTGGGRC